MMNGSALSATWAKEHAAAILEAWSPGESGGTAIAETLVGKNNPAGRLPVTFYRSIEDLPAFHDYSMQGRTFKGRMLPSFFKRTIDSRAACNASCAWAAEFNSVNGMLA